MRYRSLAMLFAVAVPAMACAGGSSDPSASEREAGIKVRCIVEFVNPELDDAQHDAFVADCVQKRMPEQQTGDSR